MSKADPVSQQLCNQTRLVVSATVISKLCMYFAYKPPFCISEPPSELRVVNVTHRAVKLEWQPGFHGGMEQYFRLRYSPTDAHKTSLPRFWDVYPANANSAIISDLDPGMEYSIDVMSMNDLGESNFTTVPVIVRTSSKNLCLSETYHNEPTCIL